jgi:hypothetical protein
MDSLLVLRRIRAALASLDCSCDIAPHANACCACQARRDIDVLKGVLEKQVSIQSCQ